MGLSIVAMLVIPLFKERLIETTGDETVAQSQPVLKPKAV
jgi:hypothetical protein